LELFSLKKKPPCCRAAFSFARFTDLLVYFRDLRETGGKLRTALREAHAPLQSALETPT
jgi:hypothetical protein